jgi:hypothetical protein
MARSVIQDRALQQGANTVTNMVITKVVMITTMMLVMLLMLAERRKIV